MRLRRAWSSLQHLTERRKSARAFQHELDHLDGILIVDHAALDELPAAIAKLEAPFHRERQLRAYARSVYDGNRPLYMGAPDNG